MRQSSSSMSSSDSESDSESASNRSASVTSVAEVSTGATDWRLFRVYPYGWWLMPW